VTVISSAGPDTAAKDGIFSEVVFRCDIELRKMEAYTSCTGIIADTKRGFCSTKPLTRESRGAGRDPGFLARFAGFVCDVQLNAQKLACPLISDCA